MTDETTFTLTLDPDLRDRFVAEADATLRHADDVLRELMRDFVERRRAERDAEIEAEIARAVREADDPSADFVSDDDVGADWLRQKAAWARRRGMRVRWLASAARGRRHQLDDIAERNPRAAIEAGDRLRAATTLLGRNPSIGRPGRHAGTREWVVTGTPFLIVYRVEAEAVTILRLFHGAQDRPGPD